MLNYYQGIKQGRKKTDYVAGVSSPLGTETINPSENWDDWRPAHEMQNRGWETSACTVFSGLDCIETLFMFYLFNDMIPPGHVKWLTDNGYFENGFINFSDRLPANYAEIEIGKGTYLYKANNAIRKNLIPEKNFPYDKDNYYCRECISGENKLLADEFNKRFTVNWQWCEEPEIGLLKSPLQGIVRYATGDGILKPEGALNHAIMVYNKDDNAYYIDDSYERDKRYGKDYVFEFISYTLTINTLINMDTYKFLKENDLKWVRNQNTGAFGRVMQEKLRVANTYDRGTLMLLDNEHRKNGITIQDDEWKQLPKTDF